MSDDLRPGSLPSRENTAPLVARYLLLLAVIIAALRVLGRGWIGAVTAGLVLAGILCTLLILLGSDRRR